MKKNEQRKVQHYTAQKMEFSIKNFFKNCDFFSKYA